LGEGCLAIERRADFVDMLATGSVVVTKDDGVINWAEAGGTVERLWQLIETDAVPWEPAAEDDDRAGHGAPKFSDDALARTFAERRCRDLRYVAFQAHWMFWDGCRWVTDSTLAAFDAVRLICRVRRSRF
jgi:hypothetical protein